MGVQRDLVGSCSGEADIFLGSGGGRGKGKCSLDGAGDHGLISQARGSLVLALHVF